MAQDNRNDLEAGGLTEATLATSLPELSREGMLQRTITGFHQDEHGDWVAELSCGHGLHMRHNPPWQVREWVLTAKGRERFIGHIVNCKKCAEAK
jgi:Protein of unknown function (DUF3565)